MLLAARSIQDFTSGQTQEGFAADRLRIRAIEREFEILGEAARNVDETTRQQFPAFLRPDPLDAAEGGLPAQNGYTSAFPS